MPRKAKRSSKASVDAPTRAVRHSVREKEAATKAPAGAPGAEVAARRHAENLAEAARYVRGDESADRRDACNAERLQAEQARIKEWARAKGCLIEDAAFEPLRVISNSTSEHEVRSRPADGCVVKKTWPGFYGQVPVWRVGKIERVPALPSQYLERQLLQNAVFDSGIVLEGVTHSDKPSMILGESGGQPSFVISQPFITAVQGDAPSPTESQIAAFLSAHGFDAVPGSYFGWERGADGVVILDARRDNFVLSEEGVIPIDLQMAVVPEIIRASASRRRPSKGRRRSV